MPSGCSGRVLVGNINTLPPDLLNTSRTTDAGAAENCNPHRTVRALSIVSAVVKVLDTTTAMVVAGSRLFSARATSTGSTFARKRSVRPLDSLAEFCAWTSDESVANWTPALHRSAGKGTGLHLALLQVLTGPCRSKQRQEVT